jgi:hypothetical protein
LLKTSGSPESRAGYLGSYIEFVETHKTLIF